MMKRELELDESKTEQNASKKVKVTPLSQDRIRGMMIGVGLGDALGAPHEFHNQIPLNRYSGKLEHPLTVHRRFQGGQLVGNVGQMTDDTEMTMTLARLIIEGRGIYKSQNAIRRYMEWANSKCTFLGKNTRKLFVGVKTVEGYKKRWTKLRGEPESSWSQSNGCLMRCSPLAVLPLNTLDVCETDCELTNFHPTCVDAIRSYVCALRKLLEGRTAAEATAKALATATELDVIRAITEGRDQKARYVGGPTKGWVAHALYCAFYALNSPKPTFQERVDEIIRLDGNKDTDTISAISGAMLGALYGLGAMESESVTGPNLKILLAVDPTTGGLPRPEKYAARYLLKIADELAIISLKSQLNSESCRMKTFLG